MKQITAIIKPFKLDEVREALRSRGLAVRGGTPSYIAAPSTWWIFCPS